MSHTVQVSPNKEETVEEIKSLLLDHDVIAVAGFRGIPAPQLQEMRANIRDVATLKVAKNTLIRIALEEAAKQRPALEQFEELIQDQTVIAASDEDAFKLFRAIEDTKSKAPASGGEVAEDDVEIEAGDTPFEPGPVVGDLQKAGIPAAIEGGSVVIQEDKVLVEEGGTISKQLADALTRLDVHPITVGLEFRAAVEDGTYFERDVLDVDVDAYRQDVAAAASRAFNLAVEVAWETPEALPPLIAKARGGARAVAEEAGFLTPETADAVVGRAFGHAMAVAERLDVEALDEELQTELFGAPVEDTGGEEA